MTDYIRDKITWDTGDPITAQSVLNDTHPMTQEWHTSDDVINATTLRTSVHFGDIAIQNATGLPFSDRLADLHELAEHPETLRLTAPYDLGLSVLAPTSLYIDKRLRRARQVLLRIRWVGVRRHINARFLYYPVM